MVCEKSNLWYYLTTIFIVNILNTQSSNKDETNRGIYLFLVLTGLFIWGAYELFGVNCVNELNTTLLYKLSLAYWITSCVLLGNMMILGSCVCCFGWSSYTERELPERSQRLSRWSRNRDIPNPSANITEQNKDLESQIPDETKSNPNIPTNIETITFTEHESPNLVETTIINYK